MFSDQDLRQENRKNFKVFSDRKNAKIFKIFPDEDFRKRKTSKIPKSFQTGISDMEKYKKSEVFSD